LILAFERFDYKARSPSRMISHVSNTIPKDFAKTTFRVQRGRNSLDIDPKMPRSFSLVVSKLNRYTMTAGRPRASWGVCTVSHRNTYTRRKPWLLKNCLFVPNSQIGGIENV
jgi:hypothetical protein